MNSAQKMTRVTIKEHGGTETLQFESARIPEPDSGEVVVQLKTMALKPPGPVGQARGRGASIPIAVDSRL